MLLFILRLSFEKEYLIYVYQNSGNPVALNELVVLTCEVNGDSEVSVTWTKDGLTSIPRAQFKNSGKILVIQNVVPGDSGVYECTAMNRFGESRTASTLIVAGT